MIPPPDPLTGALPPGIHTATWEEIVTRYGYNGRRMFLLIGLRRLLRALQSAGCRRAYLAGSIVTTKATPGDFDVCWEPEGVDQERIDPVLWDFGPDRLAQRARYRGECFPSDAIAALPSTRYKEYFQRDKFGRPVGMIAIDLRRYP